MANSSSHPVDSAQCSSQWSLLRRDRDLRHHAQACLALRQRAGGCEACRQVCPTAALVFTADGLALGSDCLGCGRCVPACPMGALELTDAHPVLPAGLPDAVPVRVDCWRVPARLRMTVAVPCLGALDAAAILQLYAQAGGRRIEILDRGWCADCPAGGAEHPARAALDAATAHLAALGVAPESRPRLKAMPLPSEVAAPEIPGRDAEIVMSRRAFFSRLSAPARQIAAEPALTQPKPPPVAAPARPSFARRRLMAALTEIAQQQGRPVPTSRLPRLQANERCRDHRGCIRVCPTGALAAWDGAWDGATGGGVRFDPGACIDCGLCERHCPERALHFVPAGPEAECGPASAYVVTRHVRRTCKACGAAFSVSNPDEPGRLCDTCLKSRRFAQNMFQQFYGARS